MSITVRETTKGKKQTEINMRTQAMTDEMTISEIGDWNPSREFGLEEAFKLINRVVVNRPDKHYQNIKRDMPIECLGLVSGLLTLNDEIEVLVRFDKDVRQYNKAAFEHDFMLVECD